MGSLSFTQAGALESAFFSNPAQTDTMAVRDSIRSPFIPSIGDLQPSRDSTSLHWTHFLQTDALFPGDILGYSPGIFLRELGEPGQPGQLIIDGLDPRRIAFHLDGQPLTDPVSGMNVLTDMPIEFIDHLEIIRGSRAFLFGGNGTGATVNVVTRQYDTNRPVTKIRFVQGPHDHQLTDGLYTQNIARDLNLMVGFLRHVTDGRYSNARFDFWNIRSRIRYNISDRLNIMVNDFYSRSLTGVNGGVLIDSTVAGDLDVFEATEAIVRADSSNQTHTRRDLSGLVAGKFFSDSSWTTYLRIYFSSMEREFSDPEGAFPATARSYSWNQIGARAQQSVRIDGLSLLLGAELEQRAVSPPTTFGRTVKNRYAWFGKAEFEIMNAVVPSVFARGETIDRAKAFSYGFDAHVSVIPGFAIEGGFSRSYRFPTFQETNWPFYIIPAGSQPNLVEQHSLTELRASFNSTSATFSVSASNRAVTNALAHRLLQIGSDDTAIEVLPSMKIRSISGLGSLKFRNFTATGTLTFTEIVELAAIKLVNPKFILTGELAYQDILFNGALEARIAARSRFMSKHQGMRFLPAQLAHVENPGKPLNAFSTFDLYGVFHIGDAFISLTWENLLNKRYFITPSYPMPDRNVRIGVQWIFLD